MVASKRSRKIKDKEILYDRISAVLTDTNESNKEIAIKTGLHLTTIKNIFNRFNTKDIIGKISFEKFKSFFNLSSNNNMMSQISR